MDSSNRRITRWPKTLIPIALVTLAALVVWLALVRLHRNPKPTLAIAVYPEGSLNAEILARDGVDLRLLRSTSAVESLARLPDRESAISAALIPDDITKEQDSPELVSLGTLFYQPPWVFSRGDLPQRTKSFAVSAYQSDRKEAVRTSSPSNLLDVAASLIRNELFSFTPSESAKS